MYSSISANISSPEAVKTSVPDQVAPKQPPKKRNRKSPGSKDQAIAQLEELQAKVHSLEQELDASKFKALYYSALIKVAEQELDIDIEKKYATRQSGSCK